MYQGLIEKNNLGVGGNVNPPAMRYDSGYYTLYRLYLDSGVNSILTCFFVFDYNISYNTLKMKRELFVFVLLSFLPL